MEFHRDAASLDFTRAVPANLRAHLRSLAGEHSLEVGIGILAGPVDSQIRGGLLPAHFFLRDALPVVAALRRPARLFARHALGAVFSLPLFARHAAIRA